jgi:hypothetical protein
MFLVHIETDIFNASHKGRSFPDGLSKHPNPTPKGASFILRRETGKVPHSTYMEGNPIDQGWEQLPFAERRITPP